LSVEPIAFATPAEWNAWLAANPDATEVWVLMHKKASGLPSITWEQAVIEALAHGWIDGIKKSYNDTSFIQRFTPRRKGSAWSQKNVGHVEKLIAEGRMTPRGMAQVEIARQNGAWDRAYSAGSTAQLPNDFIAALAQNPAAQVGLDRLNAANRFAIYYRLTSAKRDDTRAKRMAEFIAKLEQGKTII
jgi:uncharacterized protein YdeI (YjbR/CyaY-like superfamily)